MIDLNTILTQALTTVVYNVVNEQTKPLVERIVALESQADEDMARIAVLEERLAKEVVLVVQLSNRVAELTQAQPAPDDTTANSNYPHGDGQRMEDLIAKAVHDAIEAHLENTTHLSVDDVVEVVDDKISDHCGDYDHDLFISEIDASDVRDAVRSCLEDARVSLD